MTTRDFAYWLKGFFELTQTNELSSEQVQDIKNHLDLVFNKETPFVEKTPLFDYLKDNLKDYSGVNPYDITCSC